MINLMNLDYKTAEVVFDKHITGRSECSKILILEDPPRRITNFEDSDIILLFNFDNKMVMYTERVSIAKCNLLKRLKIKMKAKSIAPMEGQTIQVVPNKKYIDIITYDNNFINWVGSITNAS